MNIEAEFEKAEKRVRAALRRRQALRLWARRTFRVDCNCDVRFDRRRVGRRDTPHHWSCAVNRVGEAIVR